MPKIMRHHWIFIGIMALIFARLVRADADEDFKSRLIQLSATTEKSIAIVRNQILTNQTAPFLPDLYLQLGELLSTKAMAQYYIERERRGQGGEGTPDLKQFTSVTETQKEAISIYEKILSEFPDFQRRGRVQYLLAVSLRSIDEIPRFMQAVKDLSQKYPSAKETMKARNLLGDYLYENHLYSDALKWLEPVVASPFPYERGLAKYRMARVYLATNHPADALKLFREVVIAKDIDKSAEPDQISLESRGEKLDLKREALLESIRAYTEVYQTNTDPVHYYSQIAPNEILFAEVMEKLARRFVSIKRYDEAIKLLRTLGEMTENPQKVVSFYRDVLRGISLEDRTHISADEMGYVLNRWSQWTIFYQLPEGAAKASRAFFEQEVRDIATRDHEEAKTSLDAKAKGRTLLRAQKYYLLYLAYFKDSPNALKMALDLADVYFREGRYVDSADYYWRAYQGEYGKAGHTFDNAKNAILAAEKLGQHDFYDQLRSRGYIIRVISKLISEDRKYARDPRLVFLLLKAYYDQGRYRMAIPRLYRFLASHPSMTAAGELILDYYNTRKDYNELIRWSQKLLAIRSLDPAFRSRLTRVRQLASRRQLDEKVQSTQGYSDFAQGKSYLESALSLADPSLRSEALEQALAKSRVEGDIGTYFASANVLVRKEKDPAKRASLMRSMSQQNLELTRFDAAMAGLASLWRSGTLNGADRKSAFSQEVEVALLLRDWPSLLSLSKNALWPTLSGDLRQRIKEQVLDLLRSPATYPAELAESVLRSDPDEETLTAMLEAGARLSPGLRAKRDSALPALCATNASATPCHWRDLTQSETAIARLDLSFDREPASLSSLGPLAQSFANVSGDIDKLGGSSDVTLAALQDLESYSAYSHFGKYLLKLAGANPASKSVLEGKAQESLATAKQALAQCRSLIQKSLQATPAERYCESGNVAPLATMASWRARVPAPQDDRDTTSGDFAALQKKLFQSASHGGAALYDLAERYLATGKFHHAVAAAGLGSSTYPELQADFQSIVGCGLIPIGLLSEARYDLEKGSDRDGHKGQCLSQLNGWRSRL